MAVPFVDTAMQQSTEPAHGLRLVWGRHLGLASRCITSHLEKDFANLSFEYTSVSDSMLCSLLCSDTADWRVCRRRGLVHKAHNMAAAMSSEQADLLALIKRKDELESQLSSLRIKLGKFGLSSPLIDGRLRHERVDMRCIWDRNVVRR